MGRTCPACGHERTPQEDQVYPDWQCPACGVVYWKAEAKQAWQHLEARPETAPMPEHDPEPPKASTHGIREKGVSGLEGTESHELLALCDTILQDNEVTVEEVFGLGEWLKLHEAARLVWPGEVLARLIQAVLLDGKVTKTESPTRQHLFATSAKGLGKAPAGESAARCHRERQIGGAGNGSIPGETALHLYHPLRQVAHGPDSPVCG